LKTCSRNRSITQKRAWNLRGSPTCVMCECYIRCVGGVLVPKCLYADSNTFGCLSRFCIKHAECCMLRKRMWRALARVLSNMRNNTQQTACGNFSHEFAQTCATTRNTQVHATHPRIAVMLIDWHRIVWNTSCSRQPRLAESYSTARTGEVK
jgi:hypothetical protein